MLIGVSRKIDDPLDARAFYGSILIVVRRLQAAKRRVFRGSTPEWAKDALHVLGPLNLVSVLPTFTAILLVPRHFFTRLTDKGTKTIPLSISPTKLMYRTAALVALCVTPFGFRPDSLYLLLYLVTIAVLSPIWLALISLAIVSTTTVFPITRHIFPYTESMRCSMALFCERLNWKKYFWGCCYLGLAVLVSMSTALFVLGCCIGVAGYIDNAGRDDLRGDDFLATVVLLVGAVFLCLGMKVYVRSHHNLIYVASIYPTRRYYKFCLWQLDRLSSKFFCEDKFLYTRHLVSDKILTLLAQTIIASLEAEFRLTKTEDNLAKYLEERFSILACLSDTAVFFESDEHLMLSKCFMALAEPSLISQSECITREMIEELYYWSRE